MTSRTDFSPERENRKNQSEWTSSQHKAENDEDRRSPGFPAEGDTYSPSDSTGFMQYDGESPGFGDSGAELI